MKKFGISFFDSCQNGCKFKMIQIERFFVFILYIVTYWCFYSLPLYPLDMTSKNKYLLLFLKNSAFVVNERYLMFNSKYCPSLPLTFSYISGCIRIPRRMNVWFFEAIQKSIQFLASSCDVKCCSNNPCAIDRSRK